ncbi:EAL domain-containing protein [Microcoleus sp. FACHB-1515]|uniref:putative bifunctional diguanylate cyclase/phosphodiesterase n=1 Tax=Cyanophyceae TaxID=3028117 RepID=UPI0016889E07|nr:EAL domain-containing protein [Microcoleus sp. FACHB-1515]MBD2091184.1 EAL domain-containing protein [Microcoleus sp. FACHB-1515]
MTLSKPYTQNHLDFDSAAQETALDISHELRTPLTAIQGALDLLDSGRLGLLTEQGQRMVSIAASNVERLMRLTTTIEQEPNTIFNLVSPEELARLRLETELRSAVAHGELRLHYQPLVSLATCQINGFEALLRWQHPTLGLLAPTEFISIAEASGSILEIGLWVLREACHQLYQWQQQFPDRFGNLSVSVNLSSRQLTCIDLAAQIDQVLQETGLAAEFLKLEITETAAMNNAEVGKNVLHQLRSLGVQLYIDDFGTGYSSLNRLYDLPLDVLKIDRSFVQQLDSERGEYLVRAIANLARSLGIDVIAEGVETQEQVLKLQSLGCYRGQGYFFAKPLNSEAVVQLLC